MCGRYTQTNKLEALVDTFEIDEALLEELVEISFNVAPSQQAPVIYFREKRILAPLYWGLQPAWARDASKRLINARSESVREKSTFKHLVGPGRCVVPASGFYEFDRSRPGVKVPHYFVPANGRPIAFAGLWEDSADERCFTILTTAANGDVSPLHDRMPVILEADGVDEWLQPELDLDRFASLTRPRPDGYLAVHAVSAKVNSPKNNGPDLIRPVPKQATFL